MAAEPFLSIRERGEQLGLSSWKADRIKKELVRNGLIREVPVNPGGRGERFKLLELTSDGRQVLADFGVAPAVGLGRGGVAHQWWVSAIAAWLREQGVAVEVEDESRGVRVDLVVSIGRKRVAVEVEMGAGHAAENVRKDLAAAFDQVVSLLDDPAQLDRLEEELAAESGGIPPEVHVGSRPTTRRSSIRSSPTLPLPYDPRAKTKNQEPNRAAGDGARRPGNHLRQSRESPGRSRPRLRPSTRGSRRRRLRPCAPAAVGHRS